MANVTWTLLAASMRVPNDTETCSSTRRFLIRAANVREATAFRKTLGDILVAIDATGYCSIETEAPAKGRRGWRLWLVVESPEPEGLKSWVHLHRRVVDDLIERYLIRKYAGEGGDALAAIRERIKTGSKQAG